MRQLAPAIWILVSFCVYAQQVQVIESGDGLVLAAADGTVFLAGAGLIEPTPGAWITNRPVPAYHLVHLDPRTKKVLYATYLNFAPLALAADTSGSVVLLGGNPNLDFKPTSGAIQRPVDYRREAFIVVKIDPAGTRAVFAAVLGVPGDQFGGGSAVSIAPDGSIYLVGSTASRDFPTTDKALPQPNNVSLDALLVRLSPDASRIEYSTYLGGSGEDIATTVASDSEGNVFLTGTTRSADFPVTPGSLSSPPSGFEGFVARHFVARFDPAAGKFRYIARFGEFERFIFLTPSSGGAVVIVSRASVLHLDPSGTKAVYATGLPGSISRLLSAESDAQGNVNVVGTSHQRPKLPATANAAFLSSSSHQEPFALQIDNSGRRLSYSSYIAVGGAAIASSAASRNGNVFLSVSPNGPWSGIRVTDPAPLQSRVAADRRSVLYAFQPGTPLCTAQSQDVVLSWDTRDSTVLGVAIHEGSPDGPVVGRGLTGTALVSVAGNATYFMRELPASPFGRSEVLATTSVSVRRPVRCSAVDSQQGYLALMPNPVLACSEDVYSSSGMSIEGNALSARAANVEVRVLSPQGPLVAAGIVGVSGQAGAWVRNGMDFFLMHSGVALASDRAYVLPARVCSIGGAATLPVIRATRDCADPNVVTLAWHAGGAKPVEIRRGSSNELIGRFDTDSGIVDILSTGPETISLATYQNGTWSTVATEGISSFLPCGQGAR